MFITTYKTFCLFYEVFRVHDPRHKPWEPNIDFDRCASTRDLDQRPWSRSVLHRKEVIQPLVLERLPCYDFTPIIGPTLDS
jgi:hypothetical protein